MHARHKALRSRPRIYATGVLEYWSVGVLEWWGVGERSTAVGWVDRHEMAKQNSPGLQPWVGPIDESALKNATECVSPCFGRRGFERVKSMTLK